jgi:hypothetical protein
MEELEIEEITFDEELYKKNLEENDWSSKITNGIGDDVDETN